MAVRTDTSKDRRFSVLLLACVSVVGMGVKPPCAVGQELSGTITYSGRQVYVSDSQPILIILFALTPSIEQVDFTSVSVNGGSFVLHAPAAGEYGIFYSVDLHDYRDASASVGAPFELYENCYHLTFPARPPCANLITVPQAGATLEFDDTAILSGIAGTVTYSGIQHVTPGDSLVVQAYSNPGFSGTPDRDYANAQRNGRYELIALDPGTSHYLRAFVDLNHNRQLDPGEPFGGCSNSVVAGPDQTGVTIAFGDQGPAMCIVLPPPTPALCGDCNANGTVTANEITRVISNIFKDGAGPPPQ